MFNPKSLENLKSFDKMDRDRQREIARMGGRASAKARQQRKEEEELMTALVKYGSSFKTFVRLLDMPQERFFTILDKLMPKAKE